MFGMSLGEILIIAIIAILFVGPEKLPDTLVKIAKFFRNIKSTINEAKESFDKELQIKELKEEALNYKRQLANSVDSVKDDIKLNQLDEIYEEFNSIKPNTNQKLDDFDEIVQIEEKTKKKKKKKEKLANNEDDKDSKKSQNEVKNV